MENQQLIQEDEIDLIDPLSPEGIAKLNGEAPIPKKETFYNKLSHFNSFVADLYVELAGSVFGETDS